MTLQEKIDEMKAGVERQIPPEALAVMHGATEDLINSGATANVLKKGDTFPGFALPDQKGEAVSSGELLEKGPLVISFYRGVW